MLIALFAVLVLVKNSLREFHNRRDVAVPPNALLEHQQQQQQQQEQNLTTTKQVVNKGENIETATDLALTKIEEEELTTDHKRRKLIAATMSNFHGQQAGSVVAKEMHTPDVAANANVGASVGGSVIVFKTGDKQCCHEICDRNVKVICSSGNHDHGSSKVKLKNIVDYKWEMKNYPGHLIAVHIDGKHIAYVINVNSKLSRMEGMVRVVNAQSGLRALIKGMSGEVLDLQFAHIEKERILASIDQNSLYVHKIDLLENNLLCNLIIKVEDPLANYTPKYDKISWCPYIECPGDDDEDSSQLIVWARGSIFQCFNVNVIVNDHGIGKIHPNGINSGYLKFIDDAVIISWVALSPDGTTLGVGSIDGIIRFYQVYFHEKEPRCLHQWKPHNGKPVSSFFFLDNLTKNSADTYWKYAITGASNNTEFKVWDCGTWECLQTLSMSIASDEKKLRFIVEIDRTSSYLVISNLDTRNCYVLQIVNTSNVVASISCIGDIENNVVKDTSSSSIGSSGSGLPPSNKLKRSTKNRVYIKSISEFPLSSGILSFSIVDAAVRRYKCANDNYLCDEYDDYDEETNSIYCVVVRMFIVQSKSMQDCHILYQPTVSENTDVRSTISNDSIGSATKDSSLVGLSTESGINSGKNTKKSTAEQESDDDYDIDGDEDTNVHGLTHKTLFKEKSESNKPLEALLGITSSAAANPLSVHTSTTSSSSIVSVSAAATAVPPACANIKTESRNGSPHISNTSGYGQVNLMTPDAFSATASDKKTPECVSSEVLNTILMLASVAGSNAPSNKPDNVNLLNLVNNKIIEDQEHQKMQLKQNFETQKKFIAIDSNPGRNIGDNLASGGSSPSREVQEIMSQQDYEKSSFEELIEEQTTTVTVADAVVQGGLDVAITELDVTTTTTKTQPNSNWPKVPEVHKVTKHSAELQNAANLISQAVSASTAANLNNNCHVAPTLVSSNNSSSINNNIGSNSGANSELTELNMKINHLIDLVKVQSMQINNLQCEISDMRKTNPLSTAKGIAEFSFKLEMQLSKLMEQYLKRYEVEHKKKLSAFMTGRDVQNREMRDSFLQIINQFMLTQLSEVVSKVLTIEMQRQLMPMLAAKIDNMQQQIQIDVSQKLNAFDLMMKENISQVCKSKSIIDTFGKSVLVGVQGSLQTAFIESMSSTLIPAYEKSSQNMFKQLHEAFSVGIKEFMEQFDNYLQHLQPMQDSTEEILNKFSGFRQHLDSILLKHRNSVTETMLETRKDFKSLEILLSRQIQETIRSEVRKCFESQAVALRSQANTPAPIYDLKETIKHLLLQGQINKAFHQALLANDLNLVEFTLKSADHNAVFTPNCCLEQKVLLSLIQQISADMSHHNEIKQNYLAEALLAINPMDPITREHAPKVLQDLFRNCQMFLINHPKSPQCSNVRMLMKAVHSYKDQF